MDTNYKQMAIEISSLQHAFLSFWDRNLEIHLPKSVELSLEDRRLRQLIIGFCLVGGVFSVAYALFYLAIGHFWGAGVILSNSILFTTLPFILMKRGRLRLAAEWFLFALLSMFVFLSLIEGGMKGHAVAWLATLPICAMLVLSASRRALGWSAMSGGMILMFAGLEVAGIHLPRRYPPEWHGWVTASGYIGLALFVTVLGFLSEIYRRNATIQRDLAQSKLKSAVDELTHLNKEKNEFLGIAAHDLNNPLSVVLGYSQMLEEVDPDDRETVREFAESITESTQRMQAIIQDVLDVNRIESGEYPLNLADRPLRPLVELCVQRYQDSGREKELNWTVNLEEISAPVDDGALGQVLDNLISNAVKYATPGGRVDIRLEHGDGEAVLSVFNEGRGFTEEDKQKLFSRFAKLSTRPTGGESSTGLGLSITRKIVDAMSGSIHCHSELDQGARFEVRLPLK